MSVARIDPGLPAWAVSLAESLIAETAFHQWAGLRLLALAAGRAEVGFTAAGAMLVFGKYVHGGVLNGLLEPPGLLTMLGHMQESETAMTVDIHVQHIRSIAAGEDVVLTGRLLKRGRTTAFCAVEAHVGSELCTAARITKTIQTKAG